MPTTGLTEEQLQRANEAIRIHNEGAYRAERAQYLAEYIAAHADMVTDKELKSRLQTKMIGFLNEASEIRKETKLKMRAYNAEPQPVWDVIRQGIDAREPIDFRTSRNDQLNAEARTEIETIEKAYKAELEEKLKGVIPPVDDPDARGHRDDQKGSRRGGDDGTENPGGDRGKKVKPWRRKGGDSASFSALTIADDIVAGVIDVLVGSAEDIRVQSLPGMSPRSTTRSQ